MSESRNESLNALAERYELQVKETRQGGTPALIVAAAKEAADLIELRAGTAAPELAAEDRAAEDRAAFAAAKRLLFNAAADCWPGWTADGPKIAEADLAGALALARRSAHLVEVLNLGPMQQGHAAWLVGAFELALNRTDDALASFADAMSRYAAVPAPEMALLAQGYSVIAHESAARKLPASMPDFEQTLEAIALLDDEDSKDLAEQLRTARKVFV